MKQKTYCCNKHRYTGGFIQTDWKTLIYESFYLFEKVYILLKMEIAKIMVFNCVYEKDKD